MKQQMLMFCKIPVKFIYYNLHGKLIFATKVNDATPMGLDAFVEYKPRATLGADDCAPLALKS